MHSPTFSKIGELMATLVAMRNAQSVTQDELAKRMNNSRGYLSLIENGKKEPRISTILRYADAIGARIEITATATTVEDREVEVDDWHMPPVTRLANVILDALEEHQRSRDAIRVTNWADCVAVAQAIIGDGWSRVE